MDDSLMTGDKIMLSEHMMGSGMESGVGEVHCMHDPEALKQMPPYAAIQTSYSGL